MLSVKRAIFCEALAPCERITLAALIELAEGQNTVKASLEQISRRAQLSIPAVRRAVHGMLRKGFLRKVQEHSGRAASVYMLPTKLRYDANEGRVLAVWETQN